MPAALGLAPRHALSIVDSMNTVRLRILLLWLFVSAIGSLPPAFVGDASAQCTELIGCESWGSSPPGVFIDPDGGSWSASATSMQVVVTIGWCDAAGLNANSRQIHLDGANVSASFGWTADAMEGCGFYATSSGVVTLTPGTHTLVASITNTGLQTGADTAVFTYAQAAQPPPASNYKLQVTPDSKPVTRGANQRSTERFVVANAGSAAVSVSMAPACSGAGVAWCSTSHGALTIPGGGIVSVGVNYSTANAGSAGTVSLAAWKSGDSASVNDAGSHQVSVVAVPSPGLAGEPGDVTAFDRGACLMLPAGLDAAYECGDLRLAHTFPATRVLNTSFAPTLLYNSQHAFPKPIVGAVVHSPGPTIPTSVVATLTVAGQVPRTATFDGWINGWNRLAVGFEATGLPTGFYTYTFRVKAYYASGRDTTLYDGSGTLPIVNRSESRFGRGWWLAGLEELKVSGNGTLMWIGGDGSTLRYDPVGTSGDRWSSEKFAGTDTIVRVDTLYYRLLPGGDTVVFNLAGRHVRSSNLRGHHTDFIWSGNALVGVSLPKAPAFDTGMGYVLEYANPYGMLSRVTAPAASAAQPRVVTVENGDGRVTAFSGPDTTSVRFAYADATPRVTARRDRRRVWSTWRYDDGSRLKGATAAAGTPDSAAFAYTAQESRGIWAVAANHNYTFFDGPRLATDAADHAYFWVDRRGAPLAVQDALGAVTRTYREDPRWPGLVTRVLDPNGREVTASYDDAGRLTSTTDWATYSNGRYATTLYEWDERCGAVSRVTLPEGEVTSRGYNAQCMPEWVQPGHESSRRVTFAYKPLNDPRAPGLPESVTEPGSHSHSYGYDTRGNLGWTSTPRGNTTYLENDAIGRVIRRSTPIAEGLYFQTDSIVYDVRDRVVLDESFAPAVGASPAERLRVVSSYGDEGELLTLSRQSLPDTMGIGVLTTTWRYDFARRPVAEVAPNGQRDSTHYDPAGNADVVVNRRGHRIVMQYDELNRLEQRIVPQVTYAPRNEGIPLAYGSGSTCSASVSTLLRSYPSLPNDGACGYRIPADTSVFAYDTLTGALLSASNGDVQVSRTYFPNGFLQSETQRIRDAVGADFSKHVYRVEYAYDLNGRVTELTHPSQLAPSASQNRTRYAYDPVTGAVSGVTDPLGNYYGFAYNLRGLPESLVRPGGVNDLYGYNPDGLPESVVTTGGVRSYSLQYHPNGRVLRAIGPASRDSVVLAYSGLGHLASSSSVIWGSSTSIPAFRGLETYQYDALANHRYAYSSAAVARINSSNQLTSQTTTDRHTSVYTPGVGQLTARAARRSIPYDGGTREVRRTDTWSYDAAGDVEFATQTYWTSGSCDSQSKDEADCEDTASFYAADGVLRAVEHRDREGSDATNRWQSVFEEYRYDALGRRAWVRTRTACGGLGAVGGPRSCQGTIRRTVWDGSQELYEIQMPGEDGSPYLENDVGQLPIRSYTGWWPSSGDPAPNPQNFFEWDPNAQFGRVAYVHGGGIDQPLAVIRINFQKYWEASGGQPAQSTTFAPFAMSVLWDWRGQSDVTRSMAGTPTHCEIFSGVNRCVSIQGQRGSWAAYNVGTFYGKGGGWHGTVLTGKRDETGLMYRRARYYDPATGRFTQEDPSGLGGGLNLYGFGGGDPVNFADPSGEIAIFVVTGLVGAGIGAAVGGYKYGWKGVVGGAILGGMAGAGLGWGGAALGLLPATVGGAGAAAAGGFAGKVTMTVGPGGAATGSVAAAAAAAGPRAGAAMVRMGLWGEAAVRAVYNIGPKVQIRINGRVRIPDGVTSAAVSEVKNVARQGFTQQLADYAAHASANGLRFDLYVRSTTILSGQLQAAIQSKLVNLRFIP